MNEFPISQFKTCPINYVRCQVSKRIFAMNEATILGMNSPFSFKQHRFVDFLKPPA